MSVRVNSFRVVGSLEFSNLFWVKCLRMISRLTHLGKFWYVRFVILEAWSPHSCHINK